MEPSSASLAMASAGSWMERPQRRGSLSLTESPILRGGAGFTSTSISTIQSLHCRAVRSFAKLLLRQPSSCFYALTDYTPIRTNQIHEKVLRHDQWKADARAVHLISDHRDVHALGTCLFIRLRKDMGDELDHDIHAHQVARRLWEDRWNE